MLGPYARGQLFRRAAVILEFLTQAGAHAAGFGGPAGMWDAIVKDFSNITEPAAFEAFLQVLMIDLVLAGDHAIVVGAHAAGLPADQRKKVLLIGVIAALVLRIAFALRSEEHTSELQSLMRI